MDDYNITTLIESRNEWCARLTNILTPCLIEGINSIFKEAYNLCVENDEDEKYLMTFQNLLNNVPKWSSESVANECQRIQESSGCNYLEDLISCVHIIHLKSLTTTRVGIKQRKVNIDIPDVNTFIHKAYINVARKIYINVYLFEKDIAPLQIQKNNRELEMIIKECILNTIRDNIPTEQILRIYLDETTEVDVEVEEKREFVPDEELIKKREEAKKEAELNKIKEEIKMKVEEENKLQIKDAISSANKSLNLLEGGDNNADNAENVKSTEDINLDHDYIKPPEASKINVSSELAKLDEELDELKISNEIVKDNDIKVESLDDPDKLDLGALNEIDLSNFDNLDDANIDLGITELQ